MSSSQMFRRTMPNWVSEQSDRIGPKPPGLPEKRINPDPDYEVIDFSSQQYSNAAPVKVVKDIMQKNPAEVGLKCELCGTIGPVIKCEQCVKNLFCYTCDDMFHRHPKRQNHLRKRVELGNVRPPLPPKMTTQPQAPVPPPRRNRKSCLSSPMPERRDQTFSSRQQEMNSTVFNASLKEKLENLNRTTATRPLPDIPLPGSSKRIQERPKTNVFDAIKKPPSVAMEKIQNSTAATLDRMASLQQRYRQHKEAMNSDSSDKSRRTSTTSTIDSNVQASSTTPIRRAVPMPPGNLPPRNMSASVFNLNQNGYHQPNFQQQPTWGMNPMNQAHSMAQLNMMGNQWGMQPQGYNFNGSNMSLNMPAPGFEPQMWNPWMQQFPMMPMMPNGMPPRSMNHSRAASPALSVRSRRSMMSSRSRQKYVPQDLTDDEDSDIDNFTDDSRSRSRKHDSRRSRRNTEHSDLDHRDTEVISRIQRMKEKSKHIRERRSGSLTNWPTTKNRDSGSLTPSDDEANRISTKFRKSSLTSPTPQSKKLLSDSASEKEFPKKTAEKSIKSDSASEKEVIKETSLKRNDSLKSKKVPENESKPPVVAETKTPSESRPLKIVNNGTSNNLKENSSKKEEKKAPQVEEKSKEIVKQLAKETSTTKAVETKPVTEDWECQHCTFVNEAQAKVCTICCKTRVDVLQQLPKSEEDDIDINEINDSILQNENDVKQKDESSNVEEKFDEPQERESSPAKSDKNVKVSVSVSTGCGPSPDREIEEIFANERKILPMKSFTPLRDIPSRSSRVSIGTSPPPQSAATQTYDMDEIEPEPELFQQYPSEGRFANRGLRRSHSFATTSFAKFHEPQNLHRSLSRQSFSSELQDFEAFKFENFMNQRRFEQSSNTSAGVHLAKLLREAEQYKFNAEELQAALNHCEGSNPIVWLRENWRKLIETVQHLATKYGHEMKVNTVGTISTIEAREALRLHKGNIWHAVTQCIEQRQKKYSEIASRGNFTREDIVTSLTAHHGNLELALIELNKTQLKPFLMKIWGPPSGADNDSGNFMMEREFASRIGNRKFH